MPVGWGLVQAVNNNWAKQGRCKMENAWELKECWGLGPCGWLAGEVAGYGGWRSEVGTARGGEAQIVHRSTHRVTWRGQTLAKRVASTQLQ